MKAKQLGKYIVADPEIRHGKPTFKGTRIFVKDVLDMVADGMSWDKIIEEWRGSITKEAISEAIQLASKSLITEFLDNNQEVKVKSTRLIGMEQKRKVSGGIALPDRSKGRLEADASDTPQSSKPAATREGQNTQQIRVKVVAAALPNQGIMFLDGLISAHPDLELNRSLIIYDALRFLQENINRSQITYEGLRRKHSAHFGWDEGEVEAKRRA